MDTTSSSSDPKMVAEQASQPAVGSTGNQPQQPYGMQDPMNKNQSINGRPSNPTTEDTRKGWSKCGPCMTGMMCMNMGG
ncbi:hypothetical protein I317_06784 [Kwoniella heveanensis CBS 569]|nr:hypothetical protein I317_06784 [Kwoniella heveanensis CBS 569]